MKTEFPIKTTPLLSVIIPTFNRAFYILTVLESVLKQTYRNMEVLVVDDGSKDSTKEVLAPYLHKIQYIYQDNRGNAAARNAGLKQAKGKYVAFLDSDDYWAQEKCEKQVAFLEKHPDCAFVYCGAYLINADGQVTGKRLLQDGEDLSFETLFIKNRIISLSFVMVRKEFLDAIGGFDETLKQSPDYDLYLRLAKRYKYACLDEPLCYYRVHAGNINGNLEGRLKAHLHIFSKPQIVGDLGFYGGIRRRAKAVYQVAVLFLDEDKYFVAFKYFVLAVLSDPYFGITYVDKKFKDIKFKWLYQIFKVYYLAVFSFAKFIGSKCGFLKNQTSKGKKEASALKYWMDRKEVEGVLSNRHYKYFYTGHFGFDDEFYKGKKILDIGCGARGSLEWADMAGRRIGLDPLADEYVKLEGRNHKMEYKAGYCEKIPFEDGYFDIVCSFNSFDHVDNLDKTIKEISRVTKKDGYFLLLTDIHEKPTLREPQVFSWDVVKKFQPNFDLIEEKHYEKSEKSRGIYEGIQANIPFDHAKPSGRYGILSAKFLKMC